MLRGVGQEFCETDRSRHKCWEVVKIKVKVCETDRAISGCVHELTSRSWLRLLFERVFSLVSQKSDLVWSHVDVDPHVGTI